MNSQKSKFSLECPKFAWIILIVLGCVDIARAFIHTVLLPYAAENIMGLDLSVARDDQLVLMGTFGISNYITGALSILIALKARNIAPYVFLITPVSYFLGSIMIRIAANPDSSKYGGLPMVIGYMILSIGTFIAVIIWNIVKKRKKSK
jgi:hypothetical protein